MLLIKFDGKFPITAFRLPPSYKIVMGNYVWTNADINFFTTAEVAALNIRVITDPTLIEAIDLCDHTIHTDGTVRLYGTGTNWLGDPLTGDKFAKFMVGAKYFAKLNAKESFDARFSSIHHRESALEESTWSQQLAEAKAYIANPSTPTPLLSVLASINNQSIASFAQSVLDADVAYNLAIANLLTQLNEQYRLIDDALVPNDLKNLGWI